LRSDLGLVSGARREGLMNLARFHGLIEKVRKETIAGPTWIPSKGVCEYPNQSVEVVAVLKMMRAAHGVTALHLLSKAGLFIDFGAIMRCVNDSVTEVYFLLEKFPETSPDVDRFVELFFATTIDCFESTRGSVPTRRIKEAEIRVLRDGRVDQDAYKMIDNVHHTFSGYVHANYAHIMEVYNRATDSFNLSGVPELQEFFKRAEFLDIAMREVLQAGAFIAWRLGKAELKTELVQSWQ
jgi:hypothetical protein